MSKLAVGIAMFGLAVTRSLSAGFHNANNYPTTPACDATPACHSQETSSEETPKRDGRQAPNDEVIPPPKPATTAAKTAVHHTPTGTANRPQDRRRKKRPQ